MRSALVGAWLVTTLGCQGEPVEPAQADTGSDTSAAEVMPSDSGSTDSPATDAVADAPEELLKNPGFELGCSGWRGLYATAEESSIARTGSKSCRVCATTGTDSFIFIQDLPPAVVGAQYYGEAWLRTDPGDGGVPPDPRAKIVVLNSESTELQTAEGPAAALTSEWKKVTALLVAKQAGNSMLMTVESHGVYPLCFLVDDVSMHLVP